MSNSRHRIIDENCMWRIKYFQEILSNSTQELIARAELLPGEHVLDIGCGDGAVSLMLAERVGAAGRVYALDKSEEKLLRLTDRAASLGLDNIKPLHGLAEEILPILETVDAVYSRFVLMHVDEPQRLLGQMHRVLTEGGRVILEEPVIRATYDYPPSGVWERAIVAYRKLCACESVDPDYGLRLPKDVAENLFDVNLARQVQSVLSVGAGKEYLIAAVKGHRDEYLENGVLNQDKYNELLKMASDYGDSGVYYCAFHGVMQVIGKKADSGGEACV